MRAFAALHPPLEQDVSREETRRVVALSLKYLTDIRLVFVFPI